MTAVPNDANRSENALKRSKATIGQLQLPSSFVRISLIVF